MNSIKCCNDCDSCKTPLNNMGYSPNKLSVPYHASGLDPSQPSMASLLEKAWKAKSLSMKRKGLRSQVAPLEKATAPPVEGVAQRPSISTFLSRRLGKNILMTIKIPQRNPFPPPLVRNPPPI